jgi:uncharacterized protein YwqG
MHEDELAKQRQPAIWFRGRKDAKGSLSKLGGRPTLPPDIEWPRHGQAKTPLHFLAQIDLTTLPSTPLYDAPNAPALPKRGVLFFFADMEEEMGWGDFGGPFATTRVVYADEAGSERSPPDDTPEILHAFGELAGGYDTGIVEYPQLALEPHVIDTFSGINPFPDPSDTYAQAAHAAMVASIEKTTGPLPVFSGPGSWDAIEAERPREYIHETYGRELKCPRHQMLGFAKNIQGTAEELQAAGTILLLQIDSDLWLHKEFMFCDLGAAQFWIEPADLAKARFDKAWGTTEGG